MLDFFVVDDYKYKNSLFLYNINMPSRETNQFNNYKLGKFWSVPKSITKECISLENLNIDVSSNILNVVCKENEKLKCDKINYAVNIDSLEIYNNFEWWWDRRKSIHNMKENNVDKITELDKNLLIYNETEGYKIRWNSNIWDNYDGMNWFFI